MYSCDQSNEKAFTKIASGSGCQETNLEICLFNLEANKSSEGLSQTSINLLNTVMSSIHSTFSLNIRELMSAMFEIPGMWAAETQMSLAIHQIHISFANKLAF